MDFRSLITLIEMSKDEARQVFFTNGVNPANLSDSELKSEYRKLMMKHHPDRGGDVEIAKSLTSAYDVLKDAAARSEAKPTPPQSEEDGYSIDRPNFHDLRYVKWYFDELSKDQPSQMWTVMNFDGHFFRGMFTVRANAKMFQQLAQVMITWDRFYDSAAIMVGTRNMLENGTLSVINVRGAEVNPMISLSFDSFNQNPANDQSFCRKLPNIIDSIADGSFVTQHMVESVGGDQFSDEPIFKSNWIDSPFPNSFSNPGRGFSNYAGIYLCRAGSNSAYGNTKGGFRSQEAAKDYMKVNSLDGWNVAVVEGDVAIGGGYTKRIVRDLPEMGKDGESLQAYRARKSKEQLQRNYKQIRKDFWKSKEQ